jgi:hypothetical protein
LLLDLTTGWSDVDGGRGRLPDWELSRAEAELLLLLLHASFRLHRLNLHSAVQQQLAVYFTLANVPAGARQQSDTQTASVGRLLRHTCTSAPLNKTKTETKKEAPSDVTETLFCSQASPSQQLYCSLLSFYKTATTRLALLHRHIRPHCVVRACQQLNTSSQG